MTAEGKINWLDDIENAKKAAAGSGKPVLIFFHYKYCTGCINTIGKTLPKMSVTDEINGNFVPVMVETTEKPSDAELYNVEWTPTFVVTDETGLEFDRWEGYLPEDDFLGHLDMALARVALKKKNYADAERRFDGVVIKFPLSDLAPKACYYLGVAKYRATNDAAWLTRAYQNLREAYPESVWAIKASVWSKENIDAVKKAA
jgi:thioredoxin-related protein